MIAAAVLGREFRVAGRQRRMYWLRALVAVLLGLGLLLQVLMSFAAGMAGGVVFRTTNILTGFVFFIFLFVSVFVVAQSCGSIVDEARRGTLGVLLLTPLQPFEIVLGKFIPRACEGFSLCLVTMPFLFVNLVMGGWTAGQLLTLFAVSLAQVMVCVAITILLSALVRSAAAAFLAALVLVLGGEVLALVGVELGSRTGWMTHPLWSFLNPLAGMVRQFGMGPGDLLWSLVGLGCWAVFSLAIVALTACSLPRSLAADYTVTRSRRFAIFKRRKSRCRADARQLIYWLEWGRWRPRRNWVIGFVAIALVGLLEYFAIGQAWLVLNLVTYMALFLMKVLMIVAIVRTLQAQRQDRALELLLAMPLTDRDWTRQRLRAIWAAYGIPILWIALFAAVGSVHWTLETSRILQSVASDAGEGGWAALALQFLLSLAVALAQWYGLALLAMGVGLRSRSVGMALGMTLLLYFGIHFVLGIVSVVLSVVLPIGLLLLSSGPAGFTAVNPLMGAFGGYTVSIEMAAPLFGYCFLGFGLQRSLQKSARAWIAGEA